MRSVRKLELPRAPDLAECSAKNWAEPKDFGSELKLVVRLASDWAPRTAATGALSLEMHWASTTNPVMVKSLESKSAADSEIVLVLKWSR